MKVYNKTVRMGAGLPYLPQKAAFRKKSGLYFAQTPLSRLFISNLSPRLCCSLGKSVGLAINRFNMDFPKYSETNVASKTGINYVRTVVETSNSIFHEIHQENDIGVDAIIELIKNEHPTGKMVAIQIKSGESFYVSGKCVIPIDNHRKYWENHPLPMFGIVYVPSLSCAYWVDIKEKLLENDTSSSIKFEPSKANTFNHQDFSRVFAPRILKEMPRGFSFSDAVELLRSKNPDESFLGLIVLFREHTDNNLTWDEFVSYLRGKSVKDIPKLFPYILAHIPWHQDIWGGRDKITPESREHAKKLFTSFGKEDYVKLLQLIDHEGVARGTVGQSIEAIISSIQESGNYLEKIVVDVNLPLEIRERASLIYAYKFRKSSLPLLESIATESDVITLLMQDIKKYGGVSLY